MDQNMNNWIDNELKEVNESATTQKDLKPALKLEEKKVYEIEIDFSKPFEKYIDQTNNATKKIMPIKYEGKDMVFFLNVRNPTYREIMELAKKGQTKFKIMRMGQAKATRYSLIS